MTDEVLDLEIVLKLVDHLDAMVAFWDTNQVCRFANRAYKDWFGKTREQVVGATLQELLGPLYPKNVSYIQAALNGHTQVFEREIPTPEGNIRYGLITYTPYIVDGQVLGMFAHGADVTPLKLMEQELQAAKARAEELATHDFLTGLPNRTLLEDRIAQALAQAKRNQRQLAILCFDLDAFKQVNDIYGHAAGDSLLVEIATRTQVLMRESDTVTRLGGDEFLVLVPEMESPDHIQGIADRVLEIVQLPFPLGELTISPTVSLGIALYPQDGHTPETLMAAADRALYKAKKLGKNCYAFAGEVEAP
jgi:diguanylate cyclase (GGDEF)-like protein/PAS domain S-box-containing protein